MSDWSGLNMAIDADRAALHALVDAVPDERLAEAKAAMRTLVDPVLLALLTAPPEDEELSADELAALEQAEVERAAGTVIYVTDDELARRIGG
jgi:hypothetical protein